MTRTSSVDAVGFTDVARPDSALKGVRRHASRHSEVPPRKGSIKPGSSKVADSGSGSSFFSTLDAPQRKAVALLLHNKIGFLPAAAQQPAAMPGWLSEEVESFASGVRNESGCVDHVSSDRFCASFGAATQR
eukprot:gene4888-18575_t